MESFKDGTEDKNVLTDNDWDILLQFQTRINFFYRESGISRWSRPPAEPSSGVGVDHRSLVGACQT